MAANRRSLRSAGFTLLEMLVVVTIIGLMAGAVVLSTGVVSDERDIEHEVLRLTSLIGLVHEEAIMQSREYAILFTETGYRFYVYDYTTEQWVDPPDDALLAPRTLPETMRLEARVEERDLVLDPTALMRDDDDEDEDDDEDDDAPQPQVMLLSSGEMTAFEADFYRDAAGGRITVRGDLDGSLEVTKEGFDD